MKKNSILRCSLIIFAVIAALGLSVKAQKTDCSKKTDVEIIKAVYDKIQAADGTQIRHINVIYKDGVITIEGWASTKKLRNEFAKLAKKVECVKKVVNNLKVGDTGDCAAGQRECGDMCISEKQPCNICLVDTKAPGCFAPKEQQ